MMHVHDACASCMDGEEEEEEEEGVVVEEQKPMYSDDEIYGITKAAAEAKAAASKAEDGEKQDDDQLATKEDAVASAPAAAPPESVKSKGAGKGKRGSDAKEVKVAAGAPAAPPAAAPATAETKTRAATEGKSTREKAEERKAESAAKAQAKANAEKLRLMEEELEAKRAAAAACEARNATVQSIDFEGAWRTNGEYEIRYVAKEAGNFALHIWCDVDGSGDRYRLPGSPFHLYVSAAAPSHSGSSIEGTDKLKYAAGESLAFYPQLRDAFGNPTAAIEKQKSHSSEHKSVAESIMKELLAQHGMGALKAAQKTPPLYSLGAEAALSSTDFLPTSPVRRSLVDRTLSSPEVSPTKGRRSRGGVEAATKPPVHELTAWLLGPRGTVNLALRKDESALGKYKVDTTTNVTMAGQYEAHVTLNGQELKGSPFLFQVHAATAYGKMSFVTAPAEPAYAKLPYELRLQTLDKYGNKLTWGGSKIDGRILGTSNSACTVADHKDGSYSLHFTVNTTGSFNVEVRVDGAKVKGTAAAAAPLLEEAAEAERRAEKKLRQEERRKAREEAAWVKAAEEELAKSLEVDSPLEPSSPTELSPVARRPVRRNSVAGRRPSAAGASSGLVGKAVANLGSKAELEASDEPAAPQPAAPEPAAQAAVQSEPPAEPEVQGA